MERTDILEKTIEELDKLIERQRLEIERLRRNATKTEDIKKLWQELNQARRDNAWLMGALGVALRKCSSVVLREDDIKNIPEFEQFENIEDETVIRLKRKTAPEGTI